MTVVLENGPLRNGAATLHDERTEKLLEGLLRRPLREAEITTRIDREPVVERVSSSSSTRS